MSESWEVVGNTLYLRVPTEGQRAKEHIDWFAFPGYAEAANRIAEEHNRTLAAMQARAEQAERDLEITGDARALARFRETERERDALKVANAALSDGVLAYEARVAALEARLAEQAPVVEAAEALSDAWAKFDTFYDMHETMDNRACVDRIALLDNAVSALRAARSLRGAGEGNQEARKGEETKR